MPNANGHGPKQAALCTYESSGVGKFFRHNRARLLAWLRYYSELYEPGYSQGVPDLRGSREMRGYGLRKSLPNHVMDRLDDDEAYRCHRILLGAKNRLERERRRLYEGLSLVYFADNPGLQILDCLYEGAPDPPMARLALAAHDEAVEFMHAHVERELSRHGLERLKVGVPWWTPGAKPSWPTELQVAVLEAYYGYLETNEEPAALRKAAEETGYAAESVRKLVRRAEGVLTMSLSQRYTPL